jgi:hypothetical protein
MIMMVITIIIIYCRYAVTTAVRPLSYRGGYLNFSAWFMGMLFEQKKKKSLNKRHFIENKISLSSIT